MERKSKPWASSSDGSSEDPLHDPISMDALNGSAVVGFDGHTYNQDTFSRLNGISPMTREPLGPGIPNRVIGPVRLRLARKAALRPLRDLRKRSDKWMQRIKKEVDQSYNHLMEVRVEVEDVKGEVEVEGDRQKLKCVSSFKSLLDKNYKAKFDAFTAQIGNIMSDNGYFDREFKDRKERDAFMAKVEQKVYTLKSKAVEAEGYWVQGCNLLASFDRRAIKYFSELTKVFKGCNCYRRVAGGLAVVGGAAAAVGGGWIWVGAGRSAAEAAKASGAVMNLTRMVAAGAAAAPGAAVAAVVGVVLVVGGLIWWFWPKGKDKPQSLSVEDLKTIPPQQFFNLPLFPM